jgi:cytochrome P450
LTDPDFLANPYPTYLRMQAENPIYKERHLGWVLTRYEDVAAVLRGSHSAERPREDEPVPKSLHSIEDKIRELRRFQSLWMLYADPPQHTRLRTLVGSAFTPRRIERLRSIAAQLDEVKKWQDVTRVEGAGSGPIFSTWPRARRIRTTVGGANSSVSSNQ